MVKDTEVISRLKTVEAKVEELAEKVNSPEWVKKQFAALGGKAKSEAKQRAARENGKKGWPLPQKGGNHD